MLSIVSDRFVDLIELDILIELKKLKCDVVSLLCHTRREIIYVTLYYKAWFEINADHVLSDGGGMAITIGFCRTGSDVYTGGAPKSLVGSRLFKFELDEVLFFGVSDVSESEPPLKLL